MPGHERFVKNMLAGVGGIDLALLVIAADEGVMPQTREHLAICSLLRIKSGVVALTKTDMVEPDWLELVRDDVARLLDGDLPRRLPHRARLVEDRRRACPSCAPRSRELARAVPAKALDRTARLPVDRVFTVKGFGTVVTGTLDRRPPRGRRTRRGVSARAARARCAGSRCTATRWRARRPGQRTAVNLQGVERTAIERGDVVAPPGRSCTTVLVDATVELLADAPRPLKTRERVRFHVGTQEVMARVLLVGEPELDQGRPSYGRFRLEAPVVALPGDRYVIRTYSPVVTIGGGTLLDVAPPRFKRKGPRPGRT